MPPFSNNSIFISDNGIDLLRNKFAYRHLDYSEVQKFLVTDGYLLRNRWIIFMAGIGLILVAFKLLFPVLELCLDIAKGSSHIFYFRGLGEIMLIPLLLIGFGCYCVYQSQIKSKILLIQTTARQYNIRIREIDEAGYLGDLTAFLEEKIKI